MIFVQPAASSSHWHCERTNDQQRVRLQLSFHRRLDFPSWDEPWATGQILARRQLSSTCSTDYPFLAEKRRGAPFFSHGYDNFKRKAKGRWTKEEHESFLLGVRHCGRDWDVIGRDFVTSRSVTQIRTHAQKYFRKTERGLPFPDEPYKSMGKQRPTIPASTSALVNAWSGKSSTVTKDAVKDSGSAATEPENIPTVDAFTIAAAATAPPYPSPSPSDFLGIPSEMSDHLLSFLLDGDPTASENQASAGGLGPDWETLDYDYMAGDSVSLLSEETESREAKHALSAGAAGSATEGNKPTPNNVGTVTPATGAYWTGYDPSGGAGTAPPATSNPFSF